jgi:hypothetical protein
MRTLLLRSSVVLLRCTVSNVLLRCTVSNVLWHISLYHTPVRHTGLCGLEAWALPPKAGSTCAVQGVTWQHCYMQPAHRERVIKILALLLV